MVEHDPHRQWKILGEESVVQTPWFQVGLADVELPGGRRLDHYLFRVPPVVLTAMQDDQDRVLLILRYRFIPGTWGWELPSGIASPGSGDDLAETAARQALAESGWEPIQPRPLVTLRQNSGLTDAAAQVFVTRQAVHRGPPEADFEAARIEWLPLAGVPSMVASGEIRDAVTAAALLLLLGQAAAS